MVNRLIGKLSKEGTPVVECYNKADLCSPEQLPVGRNVVHMSAKRGLGMEELLKKIEEALGAKLHHVELLLPYSMGGQLDTLHSSAKVMNVEYVQEGIQVEAVLDEILYGRLKEYVTKEK